MQHLQKTGGRLLSPILWKACTSRTRALALLFKFFLFTLLRTLLLSPKTQLSCFHVLPHSLRKTTRVGWWSPKSPVASNEFCLRRARRSTKLHPISSPWRFPCNEKYGSSAYWFSSESASLLHNRLASTFPSRRGRTWTTR